MEILNELEFSELITDIFSKKKVSYKAINSQNRKDPCLKQELFYDLSRNHHKHTPDLFATDEDIPCEIKSPKELYDVCRFSRAHLYSFLLQTIYGQCYSYADLFRLNDDCLSIFLILPKIVRSDLESFRDIEDVFKDILTQNWQSYKTQMELDSIEFQSPSFADESIGDKYGKIAGTSPILATKINYNRKTI